MLGRAVENSVQWTELSDELPNALEILIKRAKEPSRFMSTVVGKLCSINAAAFGQKNFSSQFAAVSQILLTQAGKMSIALPPITVPGGPATYLAVIAAEKNDVIIVRGINTEEKDVALVNELVAELQDNTKAWGIEARIKALLRTDRKPAWDPLINAAVHIVRGPMANAATMVPALTCLGLLRLSQSYADNQIKQLIASGFLTTRLNEAYRQDLDSAEALLLTLFVITNPNALVNASLPLEKLSATKPEMVKEIDRAMIDFSGPDSLNILISAVTNTPRLGPLLTSVVTLRVSQHRMGRLPIGDIIANIDQYLACIADNHHQSFIQQLTNYQFFWEKLENAHLNANAVKIFHVLLNNKETRRVASDLLEKVFATVEKTGWIEAVRNNAEPFPLALDVSVGNAKKIMGTIFFDALREMIPEILASSDGSLRHQWFSAAGLIPNSHRRTLYCDIRDRIHGGTSPVELVDLLRAGKEQLLDDGKFSAEPDKAVRRIVIPLCSSQQGLQWLQDESKKTAAWITKSTDETRQVVADFLADQEKTADAAGAKIIDALRCSWKLPEPNLETPQEDTKATE